MLRILNEVLTYEVDQILIVEPQETSALQIEEGKDYCTLVPAPLTVSTPIESLSGDTGLKTRRRPRSFASPPMPCSSIR